MKIMACANVRDAEQCALMRCSHKLDGTSTPVFVWICRNRGRENAAIGAPIKNRMSPLMRTGTEQKWNMGPSKQESCFVLFIDLYVPRRVHQLKSALQLARRSA